MALYDQIGVGYARVRRADPRIAAAVNAALAGTRTVINVGAGAGSYEPCDHDREVVAVEPSHQMRAQRPLTAAKCLAGTAEDLPFPDRSVDVAMAIYSDMHWHDRDKGIAEMVRVSRGRVVLLTVDREVASRYWLTRDYLAGADDLFAPLSCVISQLPGPCRIRVVPIPHDCSDGFVHAFWKRPDALLDPRLRATMSLFARLDEATVEAAICRLRADLASGDWKRRNRELLHRDSLDLGHRLIVWQPGSATEPDASARRS